MKGILINENLPASLRRELESLDCKIYHVSEIELFGKPDLEIWAKGIGENLAILTKDADYLDLAQTANEGSVILVAIGNARLAETKNFVHGRLADIREFLNSGERILVLK